MAGLVPAMTAAGMFCNWHNFSPFHPRRPPRIRLGAAAVEAAKQYYLPLIEAAECRQLRISARLAFACNHRRAYDFLSYWLTE
jgi:hypothetical protein